MRTSPVCKLPDETREQAKKAFAELGNMRTEIQMRERTAYPVVTEEMSAEEVAAADKLTLEAANTINEMRDEYSNLLMDIIIQVLDAVGIPLHLRVNNTFDLTPDCRLLVVVK